MKWCALFNSAAMSETFSERAGATLLRSLIYDRAVQREILKVDAQFFDLAVEARQAELQSFGGFTFFRPLP